MNIMLHHKGIDLLPEEITYAHEKAKAVLDRCKVFAEEESVQVKIEIDKESVQIPEKQFVCVITVFIPKHSPIRVHSHAGGVYSALSCSFDLLDKNLHQEKNKKERVKEISFEENE